MPEVAVRVEVSTELLEDLTAAEVELTSVFVGALWAERRRAHAKHRKTSMEQAGLLDHRRASILTEEAVECAKALNDHEHGDVALQDLAGKHMPGADVLDRELIQTGTMAYTWWMNRRAHALPPPREPVKLPPDMIAMLQELADPQGSYWNALGDDGLVHRAQAALDWAAGR